jgi:hypothetical protein
LLTQLQLHYQASPAVGDEVTIMDGSASNGFATNNCIIDRNGQPIEGAAN